MLWTAEQAEAWMREHPGRWLESVSGALWCWTGITFRRLLSGEGGSLGGWPRLPAEAGEFWPPREHYATELQRLTQCQKSQRGQIEALERELQQVNRECSDLEDALTPNPTLAYDEEALWLEVEACLIEQGHSPAELLDAAKRRLQAWAETDPPPLKCWPEVNDEC